MRSVTPSILFPPLCSPLSAVSWFTLSFSFVAVVEDDGFATKFQMTMRVFEKFTIIIIIFYLVFFKDST